jgi:hypothetical protein
MLPLSALFSLLLPADTEPAPYPFVASDVGQLQRLHPGSDSIDKQTWSDLLLEAYSDILAQEVSIAGRQMLYQRLLNGVSDADILLQIDGIRNLMSDPISLAALHVCLRPLRRSEAEVATTLYEAMPQRQPRWLRWAALLPVALVAFICAVAWSPIAWLPAGAVMVCLMSLQMQYHDQVEEWKPKLHTLKMVLATTAIMGAEGRVGFAELAVEARALYKKLNTSRMAQLPGASGYADWFALANVKHYFRSNTLVFEKRKFLQSCYIYCANLEANVALARHLLTRDDWCWAERVTGSTIKVTELVHPLIQNASSLSLNLNGRGAFLSGRNGIGKSTFLRTVGINLLTARAFGFCYATSAELPALPVYASMRSEDSLHAGESLYLAELRRAKELISASKSHTSCIFLVDEIFRGTNHLESVSAAAAVLDDIASRALVLVSSHNLVLAPLLSHRLDPYFIWRKADDNLTLSSGVLAHTNGISLLADQGFGDCIEENAARVCSWLGERETAVDEGNSVLQC